jgi:hypothetical protein
MNKFYKLVLVLLPLGVLAQPTITDSWQPSVGDSYNFTNIGNTFNYPTPGANQMWDYSNISLTNATTQYFIDPASTPNAADYPNSNIVFTNDPAAGPYVYYETTASEFLDWGLVAGASDVTYTNPLTYMPFPFTFGDTGSDMASGTTFGGQGTRQTTSTYEGIGYGALILPIVTLSDILCVKITTDVTDSFGGTSSNSTTISYIFISANESYIIFSLNEVTQQGQTTKYGFLKSNYLGLNDEISSEEISTTVYPNPVNKGDNFNISIESKESKTININVIDVTGKVVNSIGSKSLAKGKNTISVKSDELEAGIYFVKIATDNNEFTSTVKMIVK